MIHVKIWYSGWRTIRAHCDGGGGSVVAQSSPTLCVPMDCNAPGSSVHGILQPGIVEWVVMPTPGDLPSPGIKPTSPAWQADSLPLSNLGSPGKTHYMVANLTMLRIVPSCNS